MWELIVCTAVAWGGCVERPPVYFSGHEFCMRALVEQRKKTDTRAIYCRPAKLT